MKRNREIFQCGSRAREPASKRRRIDYDGTRARQDSTARRQKIQGSKANLQRSSLKSQKDIKEGDNGLQADCLYKDVPQNMKYKVRFEKTEPENTSERPYVFTVRSNFARQLGQTISDAPKPNLPVKLNAKDLSIKAIVAGGMHTLCLTMDGEVYAFGSNDEGVLGTCQIEDESVPHHIAFRRTIYKISSGDCHAAAITIYGELYVWGAFRDSNGGTNSSYIGLLGLPKGQMIEQSKIPIKVDIEDEIRDVCCGLDHIVCLTDLGQVYTFGSPLGGRLGRIPPNFYKIKPPIGTALSLTPQQVRFPKIVSRRCESTPKVAFEPHIAEIWTTNYSTFAKTREISGHEIIYAWGDNTFSQLGLLDTEDRPFPQRSVEFETALRNRIAHKSSWHVTGRLKWVQITGGTGHTLALDSEGTVYGMGWCEYGQLGEGASRQQNPRLEPIQALLNERFVSISARNDDSMAVTTTGKLFGWGSDRSRQLGISSEDIHLPKLVLGELRDLKVLQASVGRFHSVILAGPPK